MQRTGTYHIVALTDYKCRWVYGQCMGTYHIVALASVGTVRVRAVRGYVGQCVGTVRDTYHIKGLSLPAVEPTAQLWGGGGEEVG